MLMRIPAMDHNLVAGSSSWSPQGTLSHGQGLLGLHFGSIVAGRKVWRQPCPCSPDVPCSAMHAHCESPGNSKGACEGHQRAMIRSSSSPGISKPRQCLRGSVSSTNIVPTGRPLPRRQDLRGLYVGETLLHSSPQITGSAFLCSGPFLSWDPKSGHSASNATLRCN